VKAWLNAEWNKAKKLQRPLADDELVLLPLAA
jgi:putative SOS response-associated peptidase YedK